MTKLLITSPQTGAAGMSADIIVIAGDYAGTPVNALYKASLSLQKPVVMIAGLMELDGTNRSRLLAEGRRQSKKYLRLRFLERDATTIEGVRFIGMHKPDVTFILAALDEPHDGPTVVVTYDEPPNTDAVMANGKVSRWVHAGTTTTEPLVVEV